MKKDLRFLLVVVLGLCSCGETSVSGSQAPSDTAGTSDSTSTPVSVVVDAKDFVATREDDREAVYHWHSAADDSKVESFTSLYAAINACVDDGDLNDYIVQEGSTEKLFVNYEKYSEETQDMYWYYDGGNTLGKYIYWEQDYWSKLRDNDKITVIKYYDNATAGNYYNGYKVVNQSTNYMLPKLNQIQGWHICTELEASATVDMVAYSGITKSVYTVKLSEAEITPTYEGGDTAYAYIGFITADANNVSNQGIKCDTTTGNWYYYSGEASQSSNSIVMDKKNCYLTSTWDEEAQCFRPDSDLTMTMELLTLLDEDGDDYIVHRMTMDFGNGRVLVKDYEISDLTQCGTIRFTCGLDIESDNTLVDYMCGAKFENIVVTSAVATVYEEMLDDVTYGSFAELYAGEFDILNSNPETDARFQTYIYTPSCVSYDFATAGKDVYGFSFDIEPAEVKQEVTE